MKKATTLKGLPLSEAAGQINQNVKIGCKDGSGFFYCGEMPELIRFHRLDEIYRERHQESLEDSRKALKRLYGKMDELLKEIERANETVNMKQKMLDERTHFLRRPVIDAYKSITEKDTLIVLIDGTERGDYWSSDECEEEI